MNDVVNMIQTVGFPIAVCLVCFWYINKREEAHEEERSVMSQIVQNNTVAMTRIADALDMGDVIEDEKQVSTGT